MKKSMSRGLVGAVLMLAARWSYAAPVPECVVGNLDAAKIAGFYQSGAQHLGEIFNLTKSAQDDDVVFSLQALGPLSSFADASYLIADLLKLRSGMTNERDRGVVDADIRANLELAGPAFYSAADFLDSIGPKAQNPDIRSAIGRAHQLIVDGIASYGSCLHARPKS
jgi:hypothetical protein